MAIYKKNIEPTRMVVNTKVWIAMKQERQLLLT